MSFLKKWAIPGLFVFILSFQTNINIFKTNVCENVHPVYGAGIWFNNLQDWVSSHNH